MKDLTPIGASIGLLDENTIAKLKKLAESKGIGYLELVRMWVLENLNKTKAA